MRQGLRLLTVMSPILIGLIVFGILSIYLELVVVHDFSFANHWLLNGAIFNKVKNQLRVDDLTHHICVAIGMTIGLLAGYWVTNELMIRRLGIMTKDELNVYFRKGKLGQNRRDS